MKYLIFVALGGAMGAVGRYLVSTAIHSNWDGRIPIGTLVVNVLGSFVIGVAFVLIERQVIHPDWRGVLMVGFLGAFTTFSTFSLETITLLESGHWGQAAVYSVISVALCVTVAGVAVQLTRWLV